MKKYTIAISIIIIALIFGIYISGILRRGVTITIHESEIVTKVNEKFPLERTHLFILTVLYADPVVEFLDESNKVRLGLTATPQLKVNDKTYSGSATVRGGFRYVPEIGEVYLTDFVVENLNIGETKGVNLEMVSTALSAALENVYSKHPVYTLKDDTIKKSTAKMFVRSIDIKDKNVIIHLGL